MDDEIDKMLAALKAQVDRISIDETCSIAELKITDAIAVLISIVAHDRKLAAARS